jgi:uncharacterized protein (DUF58 family)
MKPTSPSLTRIPASKPAHWSPPARRAAGPSRIFSWQRGSWWQGPDRPFYSLILLGWIGITAFFALNRSIDLLWGIVILLVFATVVAAALPKLQLLGVRVRRLQFPPTAMLGEPQRVGYEIEVPWRVPRYSLEIHERLGSSDAFSLAAFVPRSQGGQQWFFVWTPRQRGCWRLADLRLESRFPLGLLRASRTLSAAEHEIIVYPDFVQLRWLPVHGEARGVNESTHAPQRGGHDEFLALKPYRHGDEARRVHWRASARLGEVVTREYERQEGRQLWIVLELAAAMHVGAGAEGTCEQMIRIAHSAIVKAQSDGIPVGLLYRVADAIRRVPASADRSTYQHLREALARVQPHAQVPVHGWLERFREQLPVDGTWLIFNLGGVAQRAALQSMVRQRAATPLLVEFDTPSFVAHRLSGAHPVTLHSADGTVSIVPYAADLTELFRP